MAFRSLSREEIGEQWNYLNDQMKLIKALQQDVGRKQAAGERSRLFARNILDLTYRIEDAMESLEESRGLKWFRRLVHMASPDVREFAAEMKEIGNRVKTLERLHLGICSSSDGGGEIISSSTENWNAKLSRQTYGHQEEMNIVGREEEIEVVWSYINDPECRVIGICGMGGLGKTSLAKKLYQDDRLRSLFPHVAWVHVSDDFEPRRIFEDLYHQLKLGLNKSDRELQKDVLQMKDEELALQICRFLEGEKCMVFLDEIWSTGAGRTLSIALDRSSKVLITTRIKQVAEEILGSQKRYIHRLRYLSQHQSYELFQKRLLLQRELRAEKLEIGKEAVKFCGGLPLAVINFLQFIESKHTLEELTIVHQNLESYVRKSQEIGGTGSTLQLLSLSYDNLPHYLRPFFCYLGNFQEHAQIDVEKLYHSWVAEGLISSEDCRGGETLQDVAEMYLYNLADRSIVEVQEEEDSEVTRFKSCKLNLLMRHLSLLKSKEQGFFKVEDFGHQRGLMPDSLSQNEAFRLAIKFDKCKDGCDFHLEDNDKKHIRCLLLSAKENQQGLVWPRKLTNLVLFKYLRVLDFDGFDFQVMKLPHGIGKLLHLRSLSFRNCILPMLPSSVGNLAKLLVLDLRVRAHSKITITNVLWKLKKLMHLYFPESFDTCDAGKLRLEGLTELETLVNFNTGMLDFKDLIQLPNLRYVSSRIAGSPEEIVWITKFMKTSSHDNLLRTSLEIRNFDCYTEEKHSDFRDVLACHSLSVFRIEGHLYRLPVHTKISRNLAKIVLIGSQLIEDPMEILEQLPKLRVLILNDDAFLGEKMICSAGGFKNLKHLELLDLQNLKHWTVDYQAMPQLSTLAIGNCGKLVMQPEELKFVWRLQRMNIWQIHKDFEESVKREDRKMKLANVLLKIMFERPSP